MPGRASPLRWQFVHGINECCACGNRVGSIGGSGSSLRRFGAHAAITNMIKSCARIPVARRL
jgi:hypothetical protein